MTSAQRPSAASPPSRVHPEAVPLWKESDPTALWPVLLDRFGSLCPVEVEPGVSGWLTLDYETLKRVLNDSRTFARDPSRWWRELNDGTIPRDSSLRTTWRKRRSAIFTDGAEHAHLRAGLVGALERLSQQRIAGDVAAVADHLIDQFCQAGHADLISHYARRLPLTVLYRWFGLDAASMTQACVDMELVWDGADGAEEADARLYATFQRLIAAKRHEPGSDLVSWMLAQGLAEQEVLDSLYLVIAATDLPVTNLIGNTLYAMLTNTSPRPSQMVLVGEVVNTVIWRNPPIQHLVGRYTTRDLTLGNHHLGAGDLVLLGFGPANVDLSRTSAAAVLDPGYLASNRSHLTWGAGEHRCPTSGQRAAWAMAEHGIDRLSARLADLRIEGDPATLPHQPTTALHGLLSLPVCFTPTQAHTPGKDSIWDPKPLWDRPSSPSTSTRPLPTPTPSSRGSSPQGHSRGWLTRAWRWMTLG